jgi:hypothetical protein
MVDRSRGTIVAGQSVEHRRGAYHSRVSTMAPLLAHQGGWDEIGLVAIPIVAIIAILAVAKRRVDKLDTEPPDER